jgi:hypothetical protein
MTEPDPLVALKQATADLASLGIAYAVVGGFAVSVRAEVRFTRDVDLAVLVDLERVREDLRLIEQRGFHRRQDLVAKLQGLLDAVEPTRAD